MLVSPKRDKKAARRFFTRALACATTPTEVTTDRAPAYPPAYPSHHLPAPQRHLASQRGTLMTPPQTSSPDSFVNGSPGSQPVSSGGSPSEPVKRDADPTPPPEPPIRRSSGLPLPAARHGQSGPGPLWQGARSRGLPPPGRAPQTPQPRLSPYRLPHRYWLPHCHIAPTPCRPPARRTRRARPGLGRRRIRWRHPRVSSCVAPPRGSYEDGAHCGCGGPATRPRQQRGGPACEWRWAAQSAVGASSRANSCSTATMNRAP